MYIVNLFKIDYNRRIVVIKDNLENMIFRLNMLYFSQSFVDYFNFYFLLKGFIFLITVILFYSYLYLKFINLEDCFI